ncbi:RDD family protein [Desulfoluna sp.]|uniref:RDD family protein n=1 Tax=Desulfoluna sp. TaxID=2045199 RepID=UPI00261F08F8|nr:RDD family protein [Desulfoluna sp.]
MKCEISGFWGRVGAFFVDSILLGVFGLLLGLFFSQQFVALGGWGRAVGFPIAALYFVILNSRLGGGQTIGKKVSKIKVVDKDGELLSLPRSTLRYSVLGLPYFLNGAIISESILYPFGFCVLSLLVFGFGLSIIYLYVFNRRTRQSLHDIIAGTYVVRTNTESVEAIKQVWAVHYAICGLMIVVSLFVPVFLGQLSQNEFFKELTKTREQIQNVPQVVYATIQEGQSTFSQVGGESKTTTYLSAQAFIKTQNIEDEKLASEIANIMLKTHMKAVKKNLIQVVLSYGYDIGIASKWSRHSYSFSPEYWLDKKGQEI